MDPTGIRVTAHDLTLIVDPEHLGKSRAREVNRREILLVQYETMKSKSIGGLVPPDDCAPVVYSFRNSAQDSREINGREHPPGEQKAMWPRCKPRYAHNLTGIIDSASRRR